MNAAEIMTRAPATVTPDAPLTDVIRLLLEKRGGALPVVDGTRVVGIIADADLLRRIELGGETRANWWHGLFTSDSARAAAFVHAHGKFASDVMTRPVITVADDTSLADVASLLEQRQIGQVPVLTMGRLVGMVSRSDILRAVASRLNPLPVRTQDDQRLREAVVSTIEASGWLEGTADMTIMVEAGIVHLWGTVAGESIHRALIVAVGEIPGVREVRDHLGPAQNPDPLDRPNWPSPAPP